MQSVRIQNTHERNCGKGVDARLCVHTSVYDDHSAVYPCYRLVVVPFIMTVAGNKGPQWP